MRDKYFGAHEFQSRDEVVKVSSDRNFGLIFAGLFALIGSLSLYHASSRWHYWFLLAIALTVVALAAPSALAPTNRLWSKFGLLLHRVVSPVMLAIMFYGFLTPIGFLMRTTGKDPMRQKLEPATKSYWIVRDPPGPTAGTFRNLY
jgi:hypothetical protein